MILSIAECKAFGINPACFGRYQRKADLHIHSKYSDVDSCSPESIVRGAEALGLHTIALTDHLNLYGSRIAQDYARREGLQVRVLTGMEIMCDGGLIPQDRLMPKLKTVYQTEEKAQEVARDRRYHETHILGYAFDPNHPSIVEAEKRMIDRKIEVQAAALRIINESLRRQGRLTKEFSLEDLGLEPGIPPNRRYLYRLLEGQIDRDHLDDIMREALQEAGGYIGLSLEESIALIHSAGGLAFLAHPLIGNVVKFAMGLYSEKSFQARWDRMIAEFPQHIDFFDEVLEVLISRFRELGGDGIEAIHSDCIYMNGAVAMLERTISNYGMYRSGGSDFHVAMGGKYYRLTMPVYIGIAPPERVDEEGATFDVNKISDWA